MTSLCVPPAAGAGAAALADFGASVFAGGPASGRRGRGTATATELVASAPGGGSSETLSRGAGCGPACRNRALTRIAVAPTVAATKAAASRGPQPMAARKAKPRQPPGSASRPRSDRLAFPLGNFPHRTLRPRIRSRLVAARPGAARHDAGKRPALTTRRFAIGRQANRDPCSLPDMTFDLHDAAMQRQQSFHDRHAEAGPVVAAVVGRARLKERLAHPRQILFPDADPGILDRDDDSVRFPAALGARRDRDLAAAIGELDRVAEQIEHDLVQRALVGDDRGQIVDNLADERDAAFARP